jgi:hypothetical protein
MLTAAGKLLGYKNAGQNPQAMQDAIRRGLAEWSKLPESERAPGYIDVPDLSSQQLDPTYTRTPPDGGLIATVYSRVLERGDDGELKTCSADSSSKIGLFAGQDHLWLTQDEWKQLMPKQPSKDQYVSVPQGIATRIARYHLVDNTRGEPFVWEKDEIRRLTMELTVEMVSPSEVRLRLDGNVTLATDSDLVAAKRGYEANLLGYIEYSRERDAITRFDMVALGDFWGQGAIAHQKRDGPFPLAIAFELASGNKPADRVPPQASRYWDGYMMPTKY